MKISLSRVCFFVGLASMSHATETTITQSDVYMPLSPAMGEFDGSAVSKIEETFGEKYDAFSGRLSLKVTDIDLPGNFELPVRLTRIKDEQIRGYDYTDSLPVKPRLFGDWYIDIPFLTVVNHKKAAGVSGKSAFYDFCSTGDTDLVETLMNPTVKLLVDSSVKKFKFLSEQQSELYPAGAVYVTADNWVGYCHKINSENMGLRVLSPDGNEYILDQPSSDGEGIYASTVTDANGNWVKYKNLNGLEPVIEASDGRSIQLYKNSVGGEIVRAKVGDREWHYGFAGSAPKAYFGPRLSTVERPDGLKYEYDTNVDSKLALYAKSIKHLGKKFTETVRTPFGGVAEYVYTIDFECRGRAYDPYSDYSVANNCDSEVMFLPSLTKKKYYGLDGEYYTWDYSYSKNNELKQRITTVSGPSVISKYAYSEERLPITWYTSYSDGDELPQNYLFGSKVFYSLSDAVSGNEIFKEEYFYEYHIKKGSECTPSAAFYFDKGMGLVVPPPLTLQPFACGLKRLINPQLTSVRLSVFDTKLKKIKKTVYGKAYEREVLGWNVYGYPTEVVERNISEGTSKFSSYEYWNSDFDIAYLVGKIAKTSISLSANEKILVSERQYDNTGNIELKKKFGKVYERVASRNEYGAPESVIYGGVREIQYLNYKSGIPQVVVVPSRYDPVEKFSYLQDVNEYGEIARTVDLNGNEKLYTYDDLGRLSSYATSDSGIAATTQEFLLTTTQDSLYSIPSGQIKRVKTFGRQFRVDYLDSFGRPILNVKYDLHRPDNKIIVSRNYDERSNVVFETHPSRIAWDESGFSYSYDVINNKIKTVESQTNKGVETTPLGEHEFRVTDANGGVAKFKYLTYFEADKNKITDIVAPELFSLNLQYDALGNLTQLSSGQYQKLYVYDKDKMLCKTYSPETGWKYFGYNSLGEQTWFASGMDSASSGCDRESIDDSNKVNILLDQLGGVRYKVAPNGEQMSFVRDGNGNLLSSEYEGVGLAYKYNRLGAPTVETLMIDGKTVSLTREYDENGNTTKEVYPSGTTVDYVNDAFGNVIGINGIISSADYHPGGQLKQIAFNNGLVYSVELNQSKAPDHYLFGSSEDALIDVAIAYDNNNNVISIIDHLNSRNNMSFDYDKLDRVIWNSSSDSSVTYQYDQLGNIQGKEINGDFLDFIYDENNRLSELLGPSSSSLSYDSKGSVVGVAGKNYLYDDFGKMIGVDNETYVYDSKGRRVKKDPNGIYYFYDINGRLINKLSQGISSEYVYVLGKLVATYEKKVGG